MDTPHAKKSWKEFYAKQASNKRMREGVEKIRAAKSTCDELQVLVGEFKGLVKQANQMKEVCASFYRQDGKIMMTHLNEGQVGSCTPPDPPRGLPAAGQIHSHTSRDAGDLSFSPNDYIKTSQQEFQCVTQGDQHQCELLDSSKISFAEQEEWVALVLSQLSPHDEPNRDLKWRRISDILKKTAAPCKSK